MVNNTTKINITNNRLLPLTEVVFFGSDMTSHVMKTKCLTLLKQMSHS